MKDIACQPCVKGKSIAQGERERKHPLPDGNFRQYAIHKMRGLAGSHGLTEDPFSHPGADLAAPRESPSRAQA